MKNSNNEQYIYLLVERTLGKDKTTLEYDITPLKTLTDVNNTILDTITNTAKSNRDDIIYVSCILHHYIDPSDYSHIPFGRIEFKSGVIKIYKVLLRKIH